MKILSTLLAFGLAVSIGGVARAEQVVQFADGRSLVVEGITIDGEWAILSLDGGGRISVPTERVERFEPNSVRAPAEVRQADLQWQRAAGRFAPLIDDSARRHGLDPALLAAMAEAESAFDARAVSPKGAGGLLQLMPATAARFGVDDVFDAGQNVEGGAQYMKWLLDRFEGKTDLALAGYNAGEGAVERHRGIPPFRETRNYVVRVLEGQGRLSRPAP